MITKREIFQKRSIDRVDQIGIGNSSALINKRKIFSDAIIFSRIHGGFDDAKKIRNFAMQKPARIVAYRGIYFGESLQ